MLNCNTSFVFNKYICLLIIIISAQMLANECRLFFMHIVAPYYSVCPSIFPLFPTI